MGTPADADGENFRSPGGKEKTDSGDGRGGERSSPWRRRQRETREGRRKRSERTHKSWEPVEKGEIRPPRRALAATTLEGCG
ncbi:hypothetical protein NDU88_000425 [Pleurodeles waltl]|uniref:Uncharacterized protein n=1 Tax=Pleurodeles waltl TaxID=8319 RepID=A0AAV7TEZ6_PLEWA|nr:hypothetical protein NDU88_000423 [Pleurodeles waltl]KAJ1175134.1 hypothetical protein NDU88_000425 [Pleurodeles waltl]